jgi:hypothetical protein
MRISLGDGKCIFSGAIGAWGKRRLSVLNSPTRLVLSANIFVTWDFERPPPFDKAFYSALRPWILSFAWCHICGKQRLKHTHVLYKKTHDWMEVNVAYIQTLWRSNPAALVHLNVDFLFIHSIALHFFPPLITKFYFFFVRETAAGGCCEFTHGQSLEWDVRDLMTVREIMFFIYFNSLE